MVRTRGWRGWGWREGDVGGAEDVSRRPRGPGSRGRRRRRGRGRSRRRRGRRAWWRGPSWVRKIFWTGLEVRSEAMSLALASKSPARSGLSATRTAFPARVRPAFSKSRIFWTASWASARESGGEASDGEVGEEVVAVDGGVEGVGGGPEEGGPGEGRGEEVLPGGCRRRSPWGRRRRRRGGGRSGERARSSGGRRRRGSPGRPGGRPLRSRRRRRRSSRETAMAERPWACRWRTRGWAAGRKSLGAMRIQSAWLEASRSEESLDGADLGAEEGLGGDGEVAVALLGGEGEERCGSGRASGARGRRGRGGRSPGRSLRPGRCRRRGPVPRGSPASAARAWG